MIDVQQNYRALAAKEVLSENQIVELLKEVVALRNVAAFLASCQAATLEGLPKSTSKSQTQRHLSICLTAAKALQGDIAAIRYPSTVDHAIERCLAAVSCLQPLTDPKKEHP